MHIRRMHEIAKSPVAPSRSPCQPASEIAEVEGGIERLDLLRVGGIYRLVLLPNIHDDLDICSGVAKERNDRASI
jgi:hypothetical protein